MCQRKRVAAVRTGKRGAANSRDGLDVKTCDLPGIGSAVTEWSQAIGGKVEGCQQEVQVRGDDTYTCIVALRAPGIG